MCLCWYMGDSQLVRLGGMAVFPSIIQMHLHSKSKMWLLWLREYTSLNNVSRSRHIDLVVFPSVTCVVSLLLLDGTIGRLVESSTAHNASRVWLLILGNPNRLPHQQYAVFNESLILYDILQSCPCWSCLLYWHNCCLDKFLLLTFSCHTLHQRWWSGYMGHRNLS